MGADQGCCSTPPKIGQPFTTKNYLVQNVSSAEVEWSSWNQGRAFLAEDVPKREVLQESIWSVGAGHRQPGQEGRGMLTEP